MTGPVAARTVDGSRLHLQHGPIDLIIEAWGAPVEVAGAYRRAWDRFQPLLDELVAELPVLRRPLADALPGPASPVGRRMAAAVRPFEDRFITPMAAVAGAVADEICAAMVTDGKPASRVCERRRRHRAPPLAGRVAGRRGRGPYRTGRRCWGRRPCVADEPIRGVATSGRHGRSFSLGIADAVTVLAADAARAERRPP